MTEAVICTKCHLSYYDHDATKCPNPNWKDIGDLPIDNKQDEGYT